MTKKKRKISLKVIVGSVIIGGVAIIGMAIFAFYSTGAQNAIVRTISRVIPLPAALVNWHTISIAQLQHNLLATRHFYENQDFASIGVRVDFTTEEGKKKLKLWERAALDKLVEDEIVMILAQEHGIQISDTQAHARVQQELDRYGNGSTARDQIRRLWNFSLADFEQHIVKPQLYREALAKIAAKEQDTNQLRQKILSAKTALDQGANFETIMQQYSDGITKETANRAMWFSYDELLPEIAQVVPNVAVGTYSDIIETPRGFHIVSVDDARGEGTTRMVLLRNIVIFKPSFAQWLNEKIHDFTVRVPLHDYYWNSETSHIEFVDPQWQTFEQEVIREQFQDIPQDKK